MEQKTTTEQITDEINTIAKHRGTAREALINDVANKFISWCKNEAGLIAFPRDQINTLICVDGERQRRRIASKIISYLIKANRIREFHIKKVYYGFHNRPLTSCDYGSYKVLIERNKNKPIDKQGCYSNGNKSFYRAIAFERDNIVYEII